MLIKILTGFGLLMTIINVLLLCKLFCAKGRSYPDKSAGVIRELAIGDKGVVSFLYRDDCIAANFIAADDIAVNCIVKSPDLGMPKIQGLVEIVEIRGIDVYVVPVEK